MADRPIIKHVSGDLTALAGFPTGREQGSKIYNSQILQQDHDLKSW